MIVERYTIMNGVLYCVRGGKSKLSKVSNTQFNITLKNSKTGRNKRLLSTGYELTDKEIIVHLPDGTTKRYQNNEWSIVHTSIHYF